MLTHLIRILWIAPLLFGCSQPQARTATRPDPVAAETNVRPGINERFLSGKLTADGAREMFEVESREIFTSRFRILSAMELTAGMAVADIGAGTGLFTVPMAQKVGPTGKAYGVELSPNFAASLKALAIQKNLPQLETVQCTDRDSKLEPGSIDLAFICDTYHHFEFPKTTMATIHAALRPGGTLIVVDFERIEGVSREWTMKHVRCGKTEVVAEIESVGFAKMGEKKVDGLRENYFVLFRKL